jgi:SpoVK/Ycf46/Vps4 family AAA+-type ATPase
MLQMAMSNQAKRLSSIDFNKDVFNLSDINRLNCDDFDIDYKKLTGINSPEIIGNADPEKELDNMIGLKNIKSMIKKCIASSYMNQIRKNTFEGNNSNSVISNPMHLAFLGNPGTAKTTVARLVARILKKKGVIKKENILEVGRKDLVAQYVGHTAPLVKSVFERAKGGVLFIDEAYSLVEDRSGSFGDEAINTIIAEMENHRDDVIVIFAGYTDRMREFIARNDGLRSRLSYVLEFEDYTNEELYKIFEKIISDYELIATSEAKKFVKTIFDDASTNNDYGNGRFVRKLIENAKLNMDYRLAKLNKEKYTLEELKTLTMEDFKDIENDKILDMKKIHIGFAV